MQTTAVSCRDQTWIQRGFLRVMLILLTSYAEGKAALGLENPPFQELGTAGMGKSGC